MRLFVDTSFLIALLSQRDQFHAKAGDLLKVVRDEQAGMVTTSAILWEFLNAMSSPLARATALKAYRQLRSDPRMEVVECGPEIEAESLALYGRANDKEWGIVDCMSFIVMRQRGLTAALTGDRHFEQAGYTALLLGPLKD